MIKPRQNTIWLAIILITATVLRFWHCWAWEFSYDELSAIFRAENAKTWHHHITNGVLPDGHPAGLQSFIWIWIKFFGTNIFWLKSLMASCGIAAVYFIYKTGKNIFNEDTGLFAAMLMAVLYLPVSWSIQLRPYAPGLLVVSGLLWTVSEIIFQGSQKRKHYLFIILFLALSFYLHYFAALTSLIILVCAIVLCHKNQRLSLILCGFSSAILFLPHVGITLTQFGNKGLTWLGKPDTSFFAGHIHQIFSQSWLLFILIFIICITGFIVAIRNSVFNKALVKRIIFLIVIFLVPLLTGYIYSILRAPVLQHTVLIFSMPALLLLGGIFYGFIPTNIHHWCLSVLGVAGISVLIMGKKFYSEENSNAYRSELKYCNYYSDKFGKKCVTVWMQGENDILEYHIQKNLLAGVSYNRINYYNTEIFLQIISKLRYRDEHSYLRKNYLAVGLQSGCNPDILAQLTESYGLPIDRKFFAFGEFDLFDLREYVKPEYNSISSKNPVNFTYTELKAERNDFIIIRLKSAMVKGEIQTQIMENGKQVDWRSSKILESNYLPGDFSYSTTFHIIKLSDIPKWNENSTLMVKIEKEPSGEISEFGYRILKGNPYMYGINNEF